MSVANIEGNKKFEHIIDGDGRVIRRLSRFFAGNWTVTDAKVMADSLEEFRARYGDVQIANLVEHTVIRPVEVDIRQKVAGLSDAELASMGLARANDPRANDGPKGTPIGKDFPGDFALRRSGLKTLEEVAALTRNDLIAIEGIGEKLADKNQAALPVVE